MSSGTVNATPSDDRGGWAFGPGRRWAFLAAAVVAVAAAIVLVLLLGSGSGSGSGKLAAASKSYGHLPSWLPKSANPADDKPTYEQASSSHPVLAEEQGYTVHASVASGSADITAVGPTFPGYVANYASKGLWPANKPVPSTFYVTLTNVKGTIPIAASAFSVQDQAYSMLKATITLKDGKPAPAAVHAGQTVTLTVHSKTLEGQGAIAWTPTGKKALVAWIYQVELD